MHTFTLLLLIFCIKCYLLCIYKHFICKLQKERGFCMTDSQLHYFTKVSEFFGRVLGPDYEVALHDISDRDGALVAIANSHISGRKIGEPVSEKLKNIIENKEYEDNDFILHEYGLAPNGKVICSSSMFIKDVTGALIGALCINFDDSRYKELSQKVFNLCHPDALVDTNFRFDETRVPAKMSVNTNRFKTAPEGSAYDIITDTLSERSLNPDNMSVKDKLNVLRLLDDKGVFLIKGAVKDAAKIFGCSQATMYRHLSRIKE